MLTRSYENFDVRIEATNDAYKARVWATSSGEGTSEFDLAVAKEQLDGFLFKVGQARRRTRRATSSQIEEARRFGGLLFGAVFRGDALDCLHRCLARCADLEIGTRIRLRLADVPELSNMPWEFLYNPSRKQFLSLSNYTPIIRYLEFSDSIRPLRVVPPLRVLAVISSPTNYPQLDVEREWKSLQDALQDLISKNLVILDRLDKPRLPALGRYLQRQQVHIFHFIGHGGFDQDSSELVFEDEMSRGRSVSAERLGTILSDHRSLRLVVLNACEGARATQADPFAGTAQTLVRQGIPAVLAMQFEITDEAAIKIASEFYSSVSVGEPIDNALNDARKSLYSDAEDDVEWATPVLYLRAPDGQIFDVSQPAAKDVDSEGQRDRGQRERQRLEAATAEDRRQNEIRARREAEEAVAEAKRQEEISMRREADAAAAEAKWQKELAARRKAEVAAAEMKRQQEIAARREAEAATEEAKRQEELRTRHEADAAAAEAKQQQELAARREAEAAAAEAKRQQEIVARREAETAAAEAIRQDEIAARRKAEPDARPETGTRQPAEIAAAAEGIRIEKLTGQRASVWQEQREPNATDVETESGIPAFLPRAWTTNPVAIFSIIAIATCLGSAGIWKAWRALESPPRPSVISSTPPARIVEPQSAPSLPPVSAPANSEPNNPPIGQEVTKQQAVSLPSGTASGRAPDAAAPTSGGPPKVPIPDATLAQPSPRAGPSGVPGNSETNSLPSIQGALLLKLPAPTYPPVGANSNRPTGAKIPDGPRNPTQTRPSSPPAKVVTGVPPSKEKPITDPTKPAIIPPFDLNPPNDPVLEPIAVTSSSIRFGMTCQTLTPKKAESMGLDTTHGAVVIGVAVGSNADRAGVHPQDVILTINGKEVGSMSELDKSYAGPSSEQSLLLAIWRNRKAQTLRLN